MGAQGALLLSNSFKGKEEGPDFMGFLVSFSFLSFLLCSFLSFPFIPALLKVCSGLDCGSSKSYVYILSPGSWEL